MTYTRHPGIWTKREGNAGGSYKSSIWLLEAHSSTTCHASEVLLPQKGSREMARLIECPFIRVCWLVGQAMQWIQSEIINISIKSW